MNNYEADILDDDDDDDSVGYFEIFVLNLYFFANWL